MILSFPLCKQGLLGSKRSRDLPKVTWMETQRHGQVCWTPKLLFFLLREAASLLFLKKAPLGDVRSAD